MRGVDLNREVENLVKFSKAVIAIGESFRESKAEYMKAPVAMQDE
jgi:hypothetical protein